MAQKIIIINLLFFSSNNEFYAIYCTCPCPYINRQADSQKQKKLESYTRIGMEVKDDLLACALCLLIFLADNKHCHTLLPDPARTPGPVQLKKFGRRRKN